MAAAGVAKPQQRAARVNLSDVPELMPREMFEKQCQYLHRREGAECQHQASCPKTAAGIRVTVSELEQMFPALDPALIHALRAESSSAQHTIETLLALSASTAEPVAGSKAGEQTTSSPPKVGVEDHIKFPWLIDADGWQVPSTRTMQTADEDLGNAWRDRARAAADKPLPKCAPPKPARDQGRRQRGQRMEEEAKASPPLAEEYESRKRAGQRRLEHRARDGRGGGRRTATGRGSGARNCAAGSGKTDSEEEEEERTR